MGFSMYFMRFKDGTDVDADRDGLAEFLHSRKLEQDLDGDIPGLVGPNGRLAFDGREAELFLRPLSTSEHVSGYISHATLSPDEVAFVYDLCVAGQFLVYNPQDSPTLLVPGNTHAPEDIPSALEEDQVAWVNSPDEFLAALGGAYDGFVSYRAQVIREAGNG